MREEHLDTQVNEMIGKALGLAFITPKQFASFLVIGFLCFPIIWSNPIRGLLAFCCIYGFWWILTGNDPTKFFERLKRTKRYIAVEPELDFSEGGIPVPKQQKRIATNYMIKGKKQTYHHIEQRFKFLTYGQIEIEGSQIGFQLLLLGHRAIFIFGWTISGHSPSMKSDQSYSTMEACVNALNQMPSDIDLKIYNELEKDCEDYLRMQAGLLTSYDLDPLSSAAIRSRGKRARELKDEGRLNQHKITIYAKYRLVLGGKYAVRQSWLDEILFLTQPLVGKLQGQKFDSQPAWSRAIANAYNYAFKKADFLLSDNKGGFSLQAKAMSVQEMYRRDYLELHTLTKQNPTVPPVPQYVVYDENGLRDPIINQWGTHTIGTLFEPQGGVSAVPKFDRHLVYLPVKQKYAGFLRMGQIRQIPKDRDSVALGCLKYTWNILASSSQAVYDSRIVAELTADRSGTEFINLERTISRTTKREVLAAKKQTVDVIATLTRQKAIAAQELLDEKHIPYWVSMGIWLYRDSPEELEQDLRKLADQITGASVEVEENCAEDVWLQSLSWEWEALLTKPHHRRQKYISFNALSAVSLVKAKKVEEQGVMFVTRELSTPIYIDFARAKNHTGLFAKSGAGKSNVILDITLDCVVKGCIVVLFDFPRPDGSSTYTVLMPLLQELGVKAVYHNVRESVMNIIEMPDLRHVRDPQKYRERYEEAFNNHIRMLSTLVMGTVENSEREGNVTSLLTDCYSDFLACPEIKARYDEAIAGGFGSEAYNKMPILEDFVNYAEQWFAQHIDSKEGRLSVMSNDTIDLILTHLKGILKTALGRSINGISSFDTKVDVLVIGLTNVSENLDSLIYGMSGLHSLYRAAFNSQYSLLGIDEGTILYKFPAFARETGIIPVHGRKWGCNFLIAAQEISTILNSCSGGEIFKNLDNIFGGHIGSAALEEMTSKDVGFLREIYKRYTEAGYLPSKKLLESYWYLKRAEQHIEITHPASELLLALGATDPRENAARKRVMSQYPHDKVAGIREFARLNAIAKKQGLSMDSIYPEVVLNG